MRARMKSSKQGSALILVLLVFTLLFTMVTVGLMMVNFSVLTSTKMANLKQAQLTAKSITKAMADYLTNKPDEITVYAGAASPDWQTVDGMGEFKVSVTTPSTNVVIIRSEAQYPVHGTVDSKYIASASSEVTLSKAFGNGNPFCSALYVGDTLTLPNSTTFNGTIIMLQDFEGADVSGGSPKFTNKLIVGGDFFIDQNMNFLDQIFIDGNLLLDQGADNSNGQGVWVKGNVEVNSPSNVSVSKKGFVYGNILMPANKHCTIFADPNLTKWLVGETLDPNFSQLSPPKVLVGAVATADEDWIDEYNTMQEEFGKLVDDVALPDSIATYSNLNSIFHGLTLTINTIPAGNITSNVVGSKTTTNIVNNDSDTYPGPGHAIYIVKNNTEDIIVDTKNQDFYLELDFTNNSITNYAGKLTNSGTGRVFVYAKLPTAFTISGVVGTCLPGISFDGTKPLTRMFFINPNVMTLTLAATGTLNGFVYLPKGSFFGLKNSTINGSVSANNINFAADVYQNVTRPVDADPKYNYLPIESYYIIDVDYSSWLTGTPFEVGMVINASTWSLGKWSK